MAGVVVAAGVDAAADVQVNFAQVVQLVQILIALGDVGGYRDRARIGQRAEVAAGAGNHVGQQAYLGACQAQFARCMPQGRQIGHADPGQQGVLVVRDAGLAVREAVGQFGQRIQLVGAGVAWGRAFGAEATLERQRDDAQVRVAVRCHVALQPAGELDVVLGRGLQQRCNLFRSCQRRLDADGWHKIRRNAVQLGLRNGVRRAVQLDDLAVFLVHRGYEALAFGLDQHLDARLVLVVAPAIAVVDPHDGFDVVDDLVPRQEFAHHRGDDRRAAHATTGQHAKAQFAVGGLDQVQADVVPPGDGTVVSGTADGDFELARQEGEFGVQRAPLAQDFAERARIGHFVHGNAGTLVGADVADAVAAGLDAVHVDAGEQVHHVGAVVQADPVELHVAAGREMAVATSQAAGHGVRELEAVVGQRLGARCVVLARNAGQHTQLRRRDLAIGHGNAQHRRIALHVPAVLQAQRQEFLVAQQAILPATELVAELLGAAGHKVPVEVVVLVHRCTGLSGNSVSDRDQLGAGIGQQQRQQRADQAIRQFAHQVGADPDAGQRTGQQR